MKFNMHSRSSVTTGLLVNALAEPLGIDTREPMLSWHMTNCARGAEQYAYRVQMATSVAALRRGDCDMWDTDMIRESSQCVPYAGAPLKSATRYFWRVRVWDHRGVSSAWSDPVMFETAMLEPDDWHAKWIRMPAEMRAAHPTSVPVFRKDFLMVRRIRWAAMYISGVGYQEVYINSVKVGDNLLDPNNGNLEKTVSYSTHDVTEMFHLGRNCITAMVGQGWWSGEPSLIVKLHIIYTNDSEEIVGTDETWDCRPSHIISSSVYQGEEADARLIDDEWYTPVLHINEEWMAAEVSDISSRLVAQTQPAIECIETIAPKLITQPQPDIWIFDFGQNISGRCKLRVEMPGGTRLVMKHAELLNFDGTLNAENLRTAAATDVYTCRGHGTEEWEPKFTYHGFRYVQIENYLGMPTQRTLTAQVIHTRLEPSGYFYCSDPLLNKIYANSIWGYRDNYHSIPTDCPQRDERMGWMADAHITADMAFHNFKMEAPFCKWLDDIAETMTDEGALPDTVPTYHGTQPGDIMWTIAYHIIAWDIYRHTGHVHVLKKHYDKLRLHVTDLLSRYDRCLLPDCKYGDWIAPEETPKDFINHCALLQMVNIQKMISTAVNNEPDIELFTKQSQQLGQDINKRFYNMNRCTYANGSELSYALPIMLGIVPEIDFDRLEKNFVRQIKRMQNGHLSTGFVGTRPLMEALLKVGEVDLALSMVTDIDCPSWAYQVAMGATTIWELWNYATGNDMNSHNHPAQGFIAAYLMQTIGGIKLDENTAGWEHFTVKPHVWGNLTNAEAVVETARGRVSCKWELLDRCFPDKKLKGMNMTVQIPIGTTATVYIPKYGRRRPEIRLDGKRAFRAGRVMASQKDIIRGCDAGNYVCLELVNGTYEFEVI
ncbi:MAG: family 78 glycoside hydrolase catalytic domain [Armatimonadota bacterium]